MDEREFKAALVFSAALSAIVLAIEEEHARPNPEQIRRLKSFFGIMRHTSERIAQAGHGEKDTLEIYLALAEEQAELLAKYPAEDVIQKASS